MKKIILGTLITLLAVSSCESSISECENDLNDQMKKYDIYTWDENTFYDLNEGIDCLKSNKDRGEILLFLLSHNNSSRKLLIDYFKSEEYLELKKGKVVVTLFYDLDINIDHVNKVIEKYQISDFASYYIIDIDGNIISSEKYW